MKNDFEKIIKILNTCKNEILPPKEFLAKIISNIDFNKREEKEKGRLSVISNLINQIHKFMNLNWKLALPIIFFVAITAGLLIYSQSLKDMPQYSSSTSLREELNTILPEFKKQKDVSVPAASGNIDSAIDAILAFSINEEYAIDEEDIDAALINADDSMISDFGQSYGENEL